MKIFSIFSLVIWFHLVIFGQSFPTDSKVLQDIKKYHGKISTAEVQNDWKLERESGYNFSNMAKRVVSASTIKENGISKKIIGLAIYTRGGTGESWNFSRFFVTGSEVIGTPALSADILRKQAIELLRNDKIKVFVDYQNIAWVYDITFPNVDDHRTDRTGDVIYKCFVEYERIFNDAEGITLPNYPFEAGLRRCKSPSEAYVRLVDGEMRVAVISIGFSDALDKKMMSRKDFEKIRTLNDTPLDDLMGVECPYTFINESEKTSSDQSMTKQSKSSPSNSDSTQPKTEKKAKKFGLSKIKISGI
jgi:hypothetical protein